MCVRAGGRFLWRHRFTKIGRATQYGKRLLQIEVCPFCDTARVIG